MPQCQTQATATREGLGLRVPLLSLLAIALLLCSSCGAGSTDKGVVFVVRWKAWSDPNLKGARQVTVNASKKDGTVICTSLIDPFGSTYPSTSQISGQTCKRYPPQASLSTSDDTLIVDVESNWGTNTPVSRLLLNLKTGRATWLKARISGDAIRTTGKRLADLTANDWIVEGAEDQSVVEWQSGAASDLR